MRKIFKHNLVDYIDLGEEYIGGKRHYILPDGTKYKSVTTILSERTDKTFLDDWRKRVGNEEADKIIRQAGKRGYSFHKLCENYLTNIEDYKKDNMPLDLLAFSSFKKILDVSVDNVRGIELPLHSHTLKTAGRTDLVANFGGKLSIIDFKTSKKIKKEEWIQNYFIQATCYAIMFEEIYEKRIKQLAIIISVDHEETQLFVKNTEDYYDQVFDIFIKKAT